MLEARKKVLSGNVKEANQIINDEMEGRWFETYLPMADLHLTVGQRDNRRNMPLKQVIEPEPGDISEYERKLDLSRAVCSVSWKRDEISYQQQYFVSYPEDAAFVLIQARGKEEHCLNLAFGMDSKLHAVNGTMDEGAYVRAVSYTHLTSVEDAAAHIVKVVDTVEPDPELAAKYEEKYRKFAKIYPALKDIYSEIL